MNDSTTRILGVVFRRVLAGCLCAGALTSGAMARADEWVYVMRPGDTLIGIAEQNFANPADWPLVQKTNGIADPYRIPTGTRVRIPFRLLRPDPMVADILLVNGDVVRAESDAMGEQPLVAGDVLRAGQIVRVPAGANLSLRFADGSRLLVTEKTRFALRRAATLGDSGRREVEIELLEGAIESSVAVAPGSPRPQYEIRTPALRMAVRGTRFRAVAAADSARSEVLAGHVRVSGGRRSVELSAGYGAMAQTGQARLAARPLMPAPTIVDLPARIEYLPLRFNWTPSAEATAYRVQVLDRAENMRLDGRFDGSSAGWADLPDGDYRLRVRAVAADGMEGIDAERAFNVDARPEPPFTRTQGNVYGDAVKLEWTASADAQRYHAQVAADAGFTQILHDAPQLTATELSQSLPPGDYVWRVATIDASGDHGPFSEQVAIKLQPVPIAHRRRARSKGRRHVALPLAQRWPR